MTNRLSVRKELQQSRSSSAVAFNLRLVLVAVLKSWDREAQRLAEEPTQGGGVRGSCREGGGRERDEKD